jgi:hypothetical protein
MCMDFEFLYMKYSWGVRFLRYLGSIFSGWFLCMGQKHRKNSKGKWWFQLKLNLIEKYVLKKGIQGVRDSRPPATITEKNLISWGAKQMGEASLSAWSSIAPVSPSSWSSMAMASYDYKHDPRWAVYCASLIVHPFVVSTLSQFSLSPAPGILRRSRSTFDLSHLCTGRGVALFHTCMCTGYEILEI